jgi:hypothetical protein
MPRFAHLFLLSLPLAAMIAGSSLARATSDDQKAEAASAASSNSAAVGGGSLHETLKAMQEEMAKLREDNKAMKGEIDELRAKSDSNWLTEARATEIRNMVQDVLADSDSRASLLDDGVMAGWSEHFFLADAFGRFMLQVDGMIQTRYMYSYRDGTFAGDDNRGGFEVNRTRLTFRGHVFSENIQYLIRTEASPYPPPGIAQGAFGLLDSWVRYTFTNEWSVRAGQFKLPFMREELVSEAERLAVEQSLFNLDFSVGRSQGLELEYHDSANAWSIALSDGMTARPGSILQQLMTSLVTGQVPGMNTSALAQNAEFAITSRYERLLAGSWEQFQDFTSPMDDEFGMMVGVAINWQKNESASTPIVGNGREQMDFGVTADWSIEWGGANAFVAATYHYIDSSLFQFDAIGHLLGMMGQVGLYIAPKWEVYLRGEYMQFEGGNAQFPDAGLITFGCNYYIEGHDVKWTTDVGFSTTEISSAWTSDTSPITGWRTVNQGDEPEIVVRSQIQLLF